MEKIKTSWGWVGPSSVTIEAEVMAEELLIEVEVMAEEFVI